VGEESSGSKCGEAVCSYIKVIDECISSLDCDYFFSTGCKVKEEEEDCENLGKKICSGSLECEWVDESGCSDGNILCSTYNNNEESCLSNKPIKCAYFTVFFFFFFFIFLKNFFLF
jgi:hypothetical protein